MDSEDAVGLGRDGQPGTPGQARKRAPLSAGAARRRDSHRNELEGHLVPLFVTRTLWAARAVALRVAALPGLSLTVTEGRGEAGRKWPRTIVTCTAGYS